MILEPVIPDFRCWRLGEQIVEVYLQEGWNKILVKQAGFGGSSFYFRVCDRDGKAIQGIEVSPTPQ